jgi:hypothetical protein
MLIVFSFFSLVFLGTLPWFHFFRRGYCVFLLCVRFVVSVPRYDVAMWQKPWRSYKVRPLCEQGYVTSCVGNLTEEKPFLNISETPTPVWISIVVFFLEVGRDWVQLVRRPLVVLPALDDTWWVWSSRWNKDLQGKPKYSEKTCPSAALSTTNPTWPELGSNPGRRGRKPMTNRLSYGTANTDSKLGTQSSDSIDDVTVCVTKFLWRIPVPIADEAKDHVGCNFLAVFLCFIWRSGSRL